MKMNQPIIPTFLKANDTIGIVSTARAIAENELKFAIETLHSWNLNVKLGSTIGKQHHQFAGTDAERIIDFNEMLIDENIQAIICARGGYGSVRIIDQLNFDALKTNPKWICGYSDITVLHAALNCLEICCIHSTMPINFETNTAESLNSLKDALFGQLNSYTIERYSSNKMGNAKGRLIGGNLSVLYSIMNSPTDYDYKEAILFIEDLDEYLYHIDRLLINFKRKGLFHKIDGLIVGGMTEMNDNTTPFGQSAVEIIEEHVREFDFPVCYNFPVGHINNNLSLYVGVPCDLDVQKHGTKLSFHL